MKKKLLLLSVLLIIALAAVGCGKEETAESVLIKAQENSQKVKSMTVKGTMNMKMSSGEQTVDMNYDMDMSIFNDPYKAKIDMNIDMGELGTQSAGTYLMPEGDKFYTYTQVNGEWVKAGMDKAAFEQAVSGYDSAAYAKALLECKDDLKISEAETNGKACYKLEGTITGESLKKMIEATNMKEQLSSTNVDISIYDNLGDMKILAYVEKDSFRFYKMSMDLKDMMKKAMESASKTTSSEKKVVIDTCTMDMEYIGYDNAEDFELPAEAKDANELHTTVE